MTIAKCYFYSRKSLIISSACDYDYELVWMLHPSLRQIERTHAIQNRVIAKQWTWTCISILHERAWHTEILFQTLFLPIHRIFHIILISIRCILQELYLHGNRLTHLRQCDRYLPVSIETLTLDHNNIADLNEICTLSGLTSLNSISIQENPCVQMTNSV